MRQAAAVDTWTLDERDGDLVVRTDVAGPAARLGHRLTIAMTRWRVEVTETGGAPIGMRLEVDVSSLQVRHGEGGLRRQSALERAMTRRSALKTLEARRHPTITYVASASPVTGGYDLDGELTIHGVTRPLSAHVAADDAAYGVVATVRQTDFGIRPVSFFAGRLLVADEVAVELTVARR